MKKLNTWIIPLLTVMFLTLGIFSCTSKRELKALIITGQNTQNWYGSTLELRKILEKTGIFIVNVASSPDQGGDMSEFIVDFTPFDLVVLNYYGDNWPEETQNNFLSYVENGGGVIVYHAANNAFPDWTEYSEITGLGSWDSRDENSGTCIYVKDGKVVRDPSAGPVGSPGLQHEFLVEAFQPEHPILKGLPAKWLHTKDVLYSGLRGPAENMEILATAYADKEYGGTERNEPVLFTVTYGAGRIFHTVLGHASNKELFYPAIECAGFITTFQRGAEWAATGKVTQQVPGEFPDETKSLKWKYYEPMDIGIISERIREYDIGKSTNCFVALHDIITEKGRNSASMDEVHEMILDILSSGSASKEGKKILMKDFSWMATEDYKQVYEELSSDVEMKEEALFALERINY